MLLSTFAAFQCGKSGGAVVGAALCPNSECLGCSVTLIFRFPDPVEL